MDPAAVSMPAYMPPQPVYWPPEPMFMPGLHQLIINQVHYYFSTENLCKDEWLRGHMDSAGDGAVRSLLTFNPRHFVHSPPEDEELGAVPGSGAAERQAASAMANLKAVHVPTFYTADYTPDTTLEEFLRSLGNRHAAFSPDFRREAPLWAKEFGGGEGDMEQLLVSAKLFVQDKVACGEPTRVEDIFALHLYTMQCSIFAQSNRCMRAIEWEGIRLWRPYIFFLARALRGLGSRPCIVFRGLYLSTGTEGRCVADFLDGKWPKQAAEPAARSAEADRRSAISANSQYHPDQVVLWPAFSSTSESPGIALAYGTNQLESAGHEEHAAVILKIHTRSGCPIRQFSYYPFEEELLFAPNTAFRVKELLAPTSFNLCRGTAGSRAAFSIDTSHLVSKGLTLDEARRERVVLVEMHEEPLPHDACPMTEEDEALAPPPAAAPSAA